MARILIGYAKGVTEDANSLTLSGYLIPAVDFEHMTEVLVITELKKNADKYELYLVYEIDEKTPKATKLPNRFWELEDYKMNEIIEKIEVRF